MDYCVFKGWLKEHVEQILTTYNAKVVCDADKTELFFHILPAKTLATNEVQQELRAMRLRRFMLCCLSNLCYHSGTQGKSTLGIPRGEDDSYELQASTRSESVV